MTENVTISNFKRISFLTAVSFFLLFFSNLNMRAGDAAFTGVYTLPDVVISGQSRVIDAEIINQGNTPVTNLDFQIQILDLTNDQVVFNWSTTIDALEAGETMMVSTGTDEWLPEQNGPHLITYSMFALDDEDLTNNNYNKEFLVIPPLPFDLTIGQINFVKPFNVNNSKMGIFTFGYHPEPTPVFVNIMVRMPESSVPPVWIVQNLPLLPHGSKQEISYWVDFGLLGLEDGVDLTQIEFGYAVTDGIMVDGFDPEYFIPYDVNDIVFDVFSENTVGIFTINSGEISPIEWDIAVPTTWYYRGCDVPNIDLDSSEHNPDTEPDYAGDWNACGPASAANSLQWLEDNNEHIPDTETSHREKMKQLSKHMDRGDEEGVTTDQMLKGKLAFIDDHKLPIHVKFQSYFTKDDKVDSPDSRYGHSAENQSDSAGKPPTFEWIKNEMENGEDVEIMFGWYDRDGNRHGGHWVVLTGVSDVGTAKGLYFKDDGDQSDSGGTRQTYVNWVESASGSGWSRLVGLEGANNYCWVESAISESYDPDITFDVINPGIFQLNFDDLFEGVSSLKAMFEATYPSEEYNRYINIFVKRTDSDNYEWIARNLLIPTFPADQRIAVWWDLSWIGFAEGDVVEAVEYGFTVSDDYQNWADSTFEGNWHKLEVIREDYNKPLNTLDEFEIEYTPVVPSLPEITIGPQVTWEYRGCEVPNLDLDSSRYNPGTVEGYAGDKNACGPVGAANSMQWLEDKYKQIDTKISHREKLKELSEMMKRANNAGVYTKDFIQAKLEFIDKYKLPIKVKFQSFKFGTDSLPSPNSKYGHFAENKNSASNKPPQWDWFVSEMKHDEDVEVEIGYYDTNATRHGGHWVTAVGVSDVGTARGFYFKDDNDQRDSGGTRQQYVNWDTASGLAYLPQMSTGKYTAVVETIVSESYDPSVTHDIKDVKVEKLHYNVDLFFDVEFSLNGFYTFKFVPEDYPRYLNVVMDDVNGEHEWIIRNVLLPPFGSLADLSVWFDFGTLGWDTETIKDLKEIRVGASVSDTAKSTIDVEIVALDLVSVEPIEVVIGLNDLDEDNDIPELAPLRLDWDLGEQVTWNYRGCEVPNMDLDSSRNNPGTVEGYAGDKNACGPVSAANSLQWLDNNNDNINTGQSHRDKLKELSKMMKRSNNGGVYRQNFIKAKLEYIDKHKLPIHVKFQGWKFNTDDIDSPDTTYHHKAENKNDSARAKPKWDWLVSEMEKGEDVELEFGYYDSTGTRRGGHWVTVTGVSDNGNYRGLYFKDDINQRDSGGLRQQYVNWDTSAGKPYLVQISGKKYTCYVETVVSESYDPDIKFPDDVGDFKFENIIPVVPKLEPKGEKAMVTFSFQPEDFNRYLNVFAATKDKKDTVRIINNMLIPQFDTERRISVWFDVRWLGYESNEELDTISYYFDYSEVMKKIDEIKIPELIEAPVDKFEYIKFLNDIEEDKDKLPLASYELLDRGIGKQKTWLYRGCNVPNIDLDSSRYNPGTVEGYAGDKNACGPAGAANSLQWLDNTNEKINSGKSHREKLEELSKMMKREDNKGVYKTDFVKAKLDFIDKYKLPIHVKFQSWKHDTSDIASPNTKYGHKADNMNDSAWAKPQWDWIVSEMERGEDVELSFGYYDSTGTRRGGHWVTLTGVSDNGKYRGIYFKDDMNQRDSGGTREKYVNIDTAWGYDYLVQISGSKYTCYVEMVVSESYDSTVTFNEPGKVDLRIDNLKMDLQIEAPKWSNIIVTPLFDEPFKVLNLKLIEDDSTEKDLIRNLPVSSTLTLPTTQIVGSDRIVIRPKSYKEGSKDEILEDNLIGQTIVGVKLSDQAIVGDFEYDYLDTVDVYEVPVSLSNDALSSEALTLNSPELKEIQYDKPDFTFMFSDLPAIDLDQTKYNSSTITGYEGDLNAAGPAGAATGMQWIEDNSDSVNTGMSLREKLYMYSSMSGRNEEEGVNSKDLVRSKLEFIDLNQVSVSVLFRGFDLGLEDIESPDDTYGHKAGNENEKDTMTPTFQWVEEHVKNGYEVMVEYGFYTAGGLRIGGQWANVSGCADFGSASGIYLSKDLQQSDEGGLGNMFVNWVVDGKNAYLYQLSTDMLTCWVEGAIAQKYDPEVKFEPINVKDIPDYSELLNINVYRNPSSVDEEIIIEFNSSDNNKLTVDLYDLAGRHITRIADGFVTAGRRFVKWDGKNNSGHELPAGTYIVVVREGSVKGSIRIIRE